VTEKVEFRDTLLNFRRKLNEAEQWWRQGNREEAKAKLLRLSYTVGQKVQ
jgi:hypothetical protein